MSEEKWTPEQRQVIRSRDRDLLVSAAAGSGKTAVLVERIIRMLTDRDQPMDVDRLLVVTFTRAAAHEMKEKIRRAIDAEVLAARTIVNPTAEQRVLLSHLERQLTLVHSAKIMTIDAFCANLVRNHYNEIDLEPDFRIAEEGEVRLIAQEVMDQLMDDHYEAEDQAFLDLVDLYSRRGKDDRITDMIRDIYTAASADPWPMDWMDRSYDLYRIKSPEDMMKMPWIQGIAERIKKQAAACEELLNEAMRLSRLPGGPSYQDVLATDLTYCKSIGQAKDLGQIADVLSGIAWERLPSKRKGVDEELKERAKELRDQSKKVMDKLREEYGRDPAAEGEKISRMAPYLSSLLDLSREYASSFEARKREKNVVDFADLEHYALRILRDPADPSHPMTETAEELCRQYAEVMIDEYQDSNELQEAILSAVAGRDLGEHKTFMVGDIKQSIYSFRQAKPDLFNSKLKSYEKVPEDSTDRVKRQRIDLSRNFRSRKEILDFVNDFFYRVMQEDLGGVAYHEDVALYPGAAYPAADAGDRTAAEPAGEDPYRVEILLCDREEETAEAAGLEDKDELEARMVGERILRLMREQRVVKEDHKGEETSPLRKLRYQDIVILLRSPGSCGQAYVDQLMKMGIPAHMTSNKGYFDTVEVSRFLALLSLLNNRQDDKCLAAVMLSHVFGDPFTEDDLYLIRSAFPRILLRGSGVGEPDICRNASLWESFQAMLDYSRGRPEEPGMPSETGEVLRLRKRLTADRSLIQKAIDFDTRLNAVRTRLPYTPIHRLIEELLEETAYLNYVTGLPAGRIRRANLLKLVDEAIKFERSSYRGLYRFMNYIQKLRTYDVDLSAAELIGEEDDAVRISSIHKSKGLQYPVVFVSGLGHKFNMKDSRGDMLIDADLGISLRTRDPIRRTEADNLLHRAVSDRIIENSLAEEMRVLYVALTRAKEKLILSASGKGLQEWLKPEAWKECREDSYVLPYQKRLGAKMYLDWILPALASYGGTYRDQIYFYAAEKEEHPTAGEPDLSLSACEPIMESDDSLRQSLHQIFAYRYPYEENLNYKSKYSVSEIKHASMQRTLGDEQAQEVFCPDPKERSVPDFMRNDKSKAKQEKAGGAAGSGALRGTAMHRLMECYDFTREDYAHSLREQIIQMRSDGRLREEEADRILPDRIQNFLESRMAARIHRAALAGKLYREQPFTMGFRPSEMAEILGDDRQGEEGEDAPGSDPQEDLVLVQGIIDLFFIEDGKIVLVDYKTDRVKSKQELLDRYKAQLLLYEEAIRRAMSTDRRPLVRGQTVMYSFMLEDLVEVR